MKPKDRVILPASQNSFLNKEFSPPEKDYPGVVLEIVDIGEEDLWVSVEFDEDVNGHDGLPVSKLDVRGKWGHCFFVPQKSLIYEK